VAASHLEALVKADGFDTVVFKTLKCLYACLKAGVEQAVFCQPSAAP